MDGQGYNQGYPHPNQQQQYPPYPPAAQYPQSQYPQPQYPNLYPPQQPQPPSYDVHQNYPAYEQQQNVDFVNMPPQSGQVIMEQPGIYQPFEYALLGIITTFARFYEKLLCFVRSSSSSFNFQIPVILFFNFLENFATLKTKISSNRKSSKASFFNKYMTDFKFENHSK